MLRRSLLAAAPAFLFPSIARAANDEIKIGNIMPYSGPASPLSEVGKAETTTVAASTSVASTSSPSTTATVRPRRSSTHAGWLSRTTSP